MVIWCSVDAGIALRSVGAALLGGGAATVVVGGADALGRHWEKKAFCTTQVEPDATINELAGHVVRIVDSRDMRTACRRAGEALASTLTKHCRLCEDRREKGTEAQENFNAEHPEGEDASSWVKSNERLPLDDNVDAGATYTVNVSGSEMRTAHS